MTCGASGAEEPASRRAQMSEHELEAELGAQSYASYGSGSVLSHRESRRARLVVGGLGLALVACALIAVGAGGEDSGFSALLQLGNIYLRNSPAVVSAPRTVTVNGVSPVVGGVGVPVVSQMWPPSSGTVYSWGGKGAPLPKTATSMVESPVGQVVAKPAPVAIGTMPVGYTTGSATGVPLQVGSGGYAVPAGGMMGSAQVLGTVGTVQGASAQVVLEPAVYGQPPVYGQPAVNLQPAMYGPAPFYGQPVSAGIVTGAQQAVAVNMAGGYGYGAVPAQPVLRTAPSILQGAQPMFGGVGISQPGVAELHPGLTSAEVSVSRATALSRDRKAAAEYGAAYGASFASALKSLEDSKQHTVTVAAAAPAVPAAVAPTVAIKQLRLSPAFANVKQAAVNRLWRKSYGLPASARYATPFISGAVTLPTGTAVMQPHAVAAPAVSAQMLPASDGDPLSAAAAAVAQARSLAGSL